jgi:ankyrin repeat protein
MVQQLLETDKSNDDSEDNELGPTPLSWAAGNGHKSIVKLLLNVSKAKVDSKDKLGRTSLSWAAA